VIEEEKPLGNDVGRAVGAAAATGDILLFIDADFAIAPKSLQRFLEPIRYGHADVVLNDLDALFTANQRPHSATVWRQVLNELIGRSDLKIDSVLSVPHAITRKAVRTIGVEALADPIVAHLRLVQAGFRIAHGYAIDVITPNRFRPDEHGRCDHTLPRAEKRMAGDHLAALAEFLTTPRGGFTDGNRQRDIIQQIDTGSRPIPVASPGWGVQSSLYGGQDLSVIIPAQNEAAAIGEVIRQARKIEPKEIVVVVNGSGDATARIAAELGAKTILFEEALGNDVGRAVGAKAAVGDILLFIDGDFAIPPADLYPFAAFVAQGVDVALNDLNYYLDLRFPLHIVTACKYAVNLALDRQDVGAGSMIAVPHAISRRALRHIGWEMLLPPVAAQVMAALSGCSVRCVHRVEADRLNRIRPDQHFAAVGYPPAVERILGDHLEGLYCLLQARGPRGGLYDGNRARNKLKGLNLK
jgi:glycosyltransferase involved in cell wall biosynthesis